jgi:hypothetical protein
MQSLIQKYESLRKATEGTIDSLENLEGISEEILNNIIIKSIKSYQKKLNVGVQDSVSDLVDNFKKDITDSVFETCKIEWRISNKSCHLFPKGCRFFYDKGDTTIVVIEQEPQVRSILLDNGIMGNKYNPSEGFTRLPLSFPYVFFVIHFDKNKFKNLYSFWNNHSLKTLKDILYMPIIPNIHMNFKVCTGNLEKLNFNQDINLICEEIISNFWNSKFNNDLSNYWWEKDRINSNLKNAKEWSKKSLEDSSFILKVRSNKEKTLDCLINNITKNDFELDQTTLKQELYEDIESFTENLFHKILRYFSSVKFEKHYPKNTFNLLKNNIKKSNNSLLILILNIQNEIKKLKLELDKNINYPLKKPFGKFWKSYLENKNE